MKPSTQRGHIMLESIFLLASVLGMIACKPMPQGAATDVKTVDNFAAGSKQKTQICGPSTPSNLAELNQLVTGPDEKLRFAAIQSLAAVPANLRGALFGEKLKGKVSIVNRAEIRRQCSMNQRQTQFLNESGGELDFCWKKENNGPLRMWVVADTAIVRHGLLRLVANVYVKLIEESVDAGDANPDSKVVVAALKAARAELSSVFLREVSQKPKYAQAKLRLQTSRQQNPVEFDNELFVEMFDSVYCSADSQKDFQRDFHQSFDQFVGRTGKIPLNFTAILGLPWHAR